MQDHVDNSKSAVAAAALRRLAGIALAAVVLLAGPCASSALGQAKNTAHFASSRGLDASRTGATTPAVPHPLQVNPMDEKGTAATGEYYFGTSAVNGSTVQQHVVNFETTSSSVSYVPTVGLQYGKSYSVGAVSCTQSTLGASYYLQTCTVTVTFAPLYPGGHRDAIFVFDADGKTQLAGAFLYGIGLAPQLMIQPGVTKSQSLSGSPYLYGSATDDAGTYYVYSNSSIYMVKEGGAATQYISSFPVSYGLSIDGAGNLFSTHNNINTSGYEWLPSANAAYDVILSYTTLQDPTQNPQIVPCTTIFDGTVAVAAGNLGTYYDADYGGETCRNITWQQGLLLQPYGTQSPVTSPPGLPPDPNNVVPPYGDQPAAYPLHNGNYSPSSMLVDSYENLFFNGNNGMAVWCGLGTPGLSSAVTGSTTGCAAWGTSMVALNATTGGNMAADAADTVYIGQGYNGSTAIVMYSASNNYATPLAAIGVAGGPGNVSMAPDGTVYAQGGGTAIVAIDRSQGAIDFGLNNGQTSNPYTMTLYNGGNQPLTISSIAASGAGFSVAPTTTNGCTLNGVTVAVGTICQLQVSFTQVHTGKSTGSITITSNSLNQASTVQTIALSAELSGIYVTALPTPLNFGYVAPGSSATLPVTVTNYSVGSPSVGYGSTVAINSALSSSNPAYTVSPGTCSAPLASGASCQLQVTFNSGTTTTYPGTISWTEQITGNGPSQQISVPVSGTGVMPVSLTPTALAFGTVDVGASSAPQTLTLTNPTGNGPLSIGSITAVSGYLFTSTGSNPCGTTLADGASCTLGVIFSPVAVGSDNGVLAVKDSAGNSPQTVALTGDGIFSPDFETIHITDLLSLVPSTLLPPDVEVIHITDKLSLVSSTLLPINETIHISDSIQPPLGSAPVTPTITWPQPAAVTYGAALSSAQLNATASVAGTFAYTPAAGTVLADGMTQLSVLFTPTDTAHYTTATASVSLTVVPAPLTVSIGSASRSFDAANPAFTYSVSGFVNGDTTTAVSGSPVLSTTAVLNSPAGTYPITGTAGTLSASNYSFTLVPGTLTVTGGFPQTIVHLPIPNVPIAVGKLTLTAHSSSGIPVAYTVNGPATIQGEVLTLTGTGLVTVTATQPGNTTFAPATPVVRSFTVTP